MIKVQIEVFILRTKRRFMKIISSNVPNSWCVTAKEEYLRPQRTGVLIQNGHCV
jgi:hypothetical protein